MLREKVEKFAKRMFAGAIMALCVAAAAPTVQADTAMLEEAEPNNNPAMANLISVNTWIEGTMKDMYDEDWYTFTITTPGVTWFEIKPAVSNTNSYASWTVCLQDANRRNLREFVKHSYTDCKLGLTPGNYYIRVLQYNGIGGKGTYDLMVHNEQSGLWEQEQYYGDKTIANANIVYADNVYSGNLYCSYDVDWYRFKLSGNNKASIRFTIDDTVANPGIWRVQLIEYNSRKTIETYNIGTNATLNVDSCDGDLIVKVTNWSGTTGQIYHLQAAAIPLNSPQVTKPSTGNITTTKLVKPSATRITSIKAGKRKAIIVWKKVSKATGYYVYRATSAKGSYKRIATVKGKTSYIDKKSLKSKKRYYYKVVSFRKSGTKITKAKASGVKSVKVK